MNSPETKPMPPPVDEDKMKQWFIEAMDKWLDKKYAQFSKWTVRRLMFVAGCAIFYLIIRIAIKAGWMFN
jgi:hypothetical protein